MPGGRLRVLVVDDDPALREVLSLALVGEGYAVRTAPDGRAAAALLAAWSADLIVLDLVMPAMDGVAFLAEHRRDGARHTPVLLLSAVSNLERRAASLPADGVLAKPFDLDELCATIRRLVACRTV